jgi:hypothetical protein
MGRSRSVGICQRTGFKVPADELVQEWTGLWVWAPYYEEKHPSLDQPSLRGERVRPDATGPGSDNDMGDTDPPPTLDELGANN